MDFVLADCTVFDGHSERLEPERDLLIRNGLIEAIDRHGAFGKSLPTIKAGNRVVMPGLIDAHFHAYGSEINPAAIDAAPPTLRGLYAKRLLEDTLQRGFTTIRDAAGGDAALTTALRAGLIDGPPLRFPGSATSQTGGHGDLRLIVSDGRAVKNTVDD